MLTHKNGILINEAASSLWAKKDVHNGIYRWLSLQDHLTDTMNVAGWLWNHWLSDGQRDHIVRNMDRGDVFVAEKTVRFLGGIHDIGKATPAFQIQKGYSSSDDLDKMLLEKLEMAGYTGISKLTLASPRRTHHALAGQVILGKMGVREDIASIVGAHHGKPIDDCEECEKQDAYVANYFQSEDISSDVFMLWKQTREDILSWVLEQCELKTVGELPSFSKPAQVILSGLLIMADWIASNDELFPMVRIEQAEVPDRDKRLRDGISAWYKTTPHEIRIPLNAEDYYEKRFSFSPRSFQKIIFQTISQIKEPGIVIIEAPTGSGKTEAALAAAEQLAEKKGRGGVFFGLPTQATSNGMFSRVESWLISFSREYGSTSLRLVHGKAALNPIMRRMAMSSHMADDSEKEETVLVNEWFSGRKKTALDDVVVGTVDGFLMTALKQKHLALRHLGFDKKVVIIDEVHAYDAYMQQYLCEAIRWMGAYGVPVVLLSATLYTSIRFNLIAAYLGGRGIKKKDIDIESVSAESQKYPVISYTDGDRICLNSSFNVSYSKKIYIGKLDGNKLYERISELFRQGGILGIIVNTVRKAQDIARCCIEQFGSENVILLHSCYISPDRIRKEEQLLQLIGKGADRPKKYIVIGTQVIEQSLDIDFDVLITDLCPIDLMIQRIGRLHRHEISRPEPHRLPVVYVLGTSDILQFEQGSEKVYGSLLLARTQFYLPETMLIPQDVPRLVQLVYSIDEPIPEHVCEAVKRIYNDSLNHFKREKSEKEKKAQQFRIGHPSLRILPEKYNLTGWLNDPDHSDTEETAFAQVRDTRETIEVIALQTYGLGYGLINTKDRVQKNMSVHIEEPEVQRKLAEQTLRLPYSVNLLAGGTGKLIEELEQYNRSRLHEWQDKPWLKGSLCILFDENREFRIGKVLLCYDELYGLSVSSQNEETS